MLLFRVDFIFGGCECLCVITDGIVEIEHDNTVKNILQIQIKLFRTNDSPWFINLAHDLLLCIQTNRNISNLRRNL